jgi:hypothetical protein
MKNMMRRVRRLQSIIPPVPPPKPITEEDRKFSAMAAILLQRMDPAHARLVTDDLKAVGRDSSQHYSNLTFVVFERVMNHLKKNQPLELPAKVAMLEMSGEGGATTYNCEDCGYDLPGNWPRLNSDWTTPSQISYEPCPLCGGKVGWHAFYTKHKCNREQVPLLAEQTLPDVMKGQ